MIATEAKIEVAMFPVEHLPLVWKWFHDFSDQMLDDYVPKTCEEMIETHKANLEKGGLGYGVWKDGPTPLGAIWFDLLGDGMYSGHLVFERKALTRQEMKEAVELAMTEVFKVGRKIYWQFLASNRAFHIFMRSIGAVEEGYQRQADRCNGNLVDVRLMASFPKG